MSELIEKVARAIYTDRNGKWDYKAYKSDARIGEAYRKDAEAALKCLSTIDENYIKQIAQDVYKVHITEGDLENTRNTILNYLAPPHSL